MAKKIKTVESSSTEEIVKKVKSAFIEVLVRDWLNSPCKEWGGITPLAIIKKGEGQKLLDAIKKADEEIKIERNSKKEKNDGDGKRNVEESVGEKTIFS